MKYIEGPIAGFTIEPSILAIKFLAEGYETLLLI